MLTKKVKILYSISISIFLIYSFYLYANYNSIKEIVPIHYNLKGEADGFGDRVYLVYLNIAHLILLIILLIGIMNPKYANYPYEITDSNRDASYKNMQYFLSVIAILTSLAFAYMLYKEIDSINNSYIYLISFITIVPLIVFFYFKEK